MDSLAYQMIKGRKIKIAYLLHGIGYGGGTASFSLLLKNINKRKFDNYILTPDCPNKKRKDAFSKNSEGLFLTRLLRINNNQVTKTPLITFFFKKSIPCNKFIRTLNQHGIDILHVNTTVFSHLLQRIKHNCDIKVVTHVRELIPRYGNGLVQKYMINNIYNYSDAIIAISDNEAKPFIGHPNLHVLPNPFDFSKVGQIDSTFRKEHGISDNVIIIGMLGQFGKKKGHLELLKALKSILDRNLEKCPMLFVILGVKFPKTPIWKVVAKKVLLKEDYLKTLLTYIKDNNLGHFVKLLPFTMNIFSALQAMDIVVRPSLPADPWGRDIIEAMAMSKPVVATGSSEFYIENNVTGYLVPPKDSKLMADKISDLIHDPKKRRIFGQRGFLKVRKMCDMVEYGRKVTHIYESLTAIKT